MKAKRPHTPIRVKLAAALLQLGLDPATAELDHDPALALRMKRTMPDGSVVYSPDANDPRRMTWRAKPGHLEKTTGRKVGAAKTATTYGSDAHAIAKTERLEAARAALAQAELRGQIVRQRRRKASSRWPQGRKIKSRPMRNPVLKDR